MPPLLIPHRLNADTFLHPARLVADIVSIFGHTAAGKTAAVVPALGETLSVSASRTAPRPPVVLTNATPGVEP
jgi:hypothetical protein